MAFAVDERVRIACAALGMGLLVVVRGGKFLCIYTLLLYDIYYWWVPRAQHQQQKPPRGKEISVS